MIRLLNDEEIGEIVGGCKKWHEIPDKIAKAQLQYDLKEFIKELEDVCTWKHLEELLESLKKLEEEK